MTDSYDVLARLEDLERKSRQKYTHTESPFLNEEEQAAARSAFPESALIHYEGGYPEARKKKVIFLRDEEDDFSDIVCISARVDQRFRTISHRDILGSIMSLQVDRHSFGDFWIEEDKKRIYLYTSASMGTFLCDNLIRIASLSVSFEVTDERPAQVFRTREFEAVITGERIDCVVAALAKVSRSEAQRMIRADKVQINHRPLVDTDELCDNDCTISIRGTGRFRYRGVVRRTRKDRIVAQFSQDI